MNIRRSALLRCSIASHAESGAGADAIQMAGLSSSNAVANRNIRGGVNCKLGLATTQVLDEGVASDHHTRRSMGLQPPASV